MKKISGITYLKAFLPLFVVACHIRPFGKSASMSLPLPDMPSLKDVFYLNVCSMAVPLFFVVSFFLYLKKRERTENHFQLCVKRICYLLGLFLFFRIVYAFFDIGKLWVSERGLFKNLYALAFGGGDTPLYYLELCSYFIVFIELCCFVIEKFKINKKSFSIVGFILSLVLLLVVYNLPFETLKYEALTYYSPLSFLPCVFIAFYFNDSADHNFAFLLLLFVTGVVLAVIEWKTLPSSSFLEKGISLSVPSYARLSPAFLSAAIFGSMLKIKTDASKFTEYLASLSLYVYCLHQIFIKYITIYIHSSLVGYLLVVAASYFASMVISFIVTTVKSHFAR